MFSNNTRVVFFSHLAHGVALFLCTKQWTVTYSVTSI